MMERKTPVSILHEAMAKIGTVPHYEFCDNILNSAVPKIFTCKVTCSGIVTDGSGVCKKDAKQNAAKAMLIKLHKTDVIAQSSAICEVSNTETSVQPSTENGGALNNSIQELQALCFKYNLEKPIFNDKEPFGPPHARMHNVQCIVSTFTLDGVGKTKKLAKHDAATQMIEKIKHTCDSDSLSKIEKSRNLKISERVTKNFTSKPSQMNKTTDSTKLKINYDFKMPSEPKELVKNLKRLHCDPLVKLEHISTLLKRCNEKLSQENMFIVKQEFQNLLESAKIDFHHMLLQTTEPITYMLIVQLNTVPDLLEMSLGSTREEAELRTISKVIETLKRFFK